MKNIPGFLKSPVLYIVIFLFLIVGGIYWAFEYKEKKALSKPDDVSILQTWELTEKLMELSGISYMGDKKIACVQDEEGIIFVFDLVSKKVVREINFGDPGDYEAISIHGETAYILRSDGTVFQAEIPSGGKTETSAVAYEIPAFKGFDMESLCYDKQHHRLLLLPKENQAKSEWKKVYAFDLGAKKLAPNPVFEIDLKDKIREFDYGNEVLKGEEFEKIEPADMAIHPLSGDIYIIDASSHLILKFSPAGKLTGVYRLNSYIFPNPEGLTFGPKGELYLSSEGTIGSLANIWKIELEEGKWKAFDNIQR